MTKLISPLLSFSAKGTIADTLTFQKKGTATIARNKPTPTYTKTLPQQYQRWLYEDYCYLWRQQTSLVKATYAAKAARHHTTAISEWLRYNLTYLPDIALYLPLDQKQGTLVIDRSKHGNNGTWVGATITPGVIDHALSFDGLNDYIKVLASASLNISGKALTIECFLRPTSTGWTQFLIEKGNSFRVRTPQDTASRNISFDLYQSGVGWNYFKVNAALNWGVLQHFTFTYDGINRRMYRDGIQIGQQATTFAIPTAPTNDLYIGMELGLSNPLKAIVDQLVLYPRVLDATEILNHSQRRYPIQ